MNPLADLMFALGNARFRFLAMGACVLATAIGVSAGALHVDVPHRSTSHEFTTTTSQVAPTTEAMVPTTETNISREPSVGESYRQDSLPFPRTASAPDRRSAPPATVAAQETTTQAPIQADTTSTTAGVTTVPSVPPTTEPDHTFDTVDPPTIPVPDVEPDTPPEEPTDPPADDTTTPTNDQGGTTNDAGVESPTGNPGT